MSAISRSVTTWTSHRIAPDAQKAKATGKKASSVATTWYYVKYSY